MTRLFDPITIARQFLYVREAQGIGQNRGLRVEAIQHWAGGQTGDSWCAEMLWMWFDIAYQGDPPFGRQPSCQALREMCQAQTWMVDTPERGDIVFSIDENGRAHHVALCTLDNPLVTIAGNTSADGVSVNGDRVAEHPIGTANKLFARVPV